MTVNRLAKTQRDKLLY